MATFKNTIAIVVALAIGCIVMGSDELSRSTPRGDYKEEAQSYTKGWEKLRLNAYKDNTRYSIGYGTLSRAGEKITLAEADKRFSVYWEEHIGDINKYVSNKGQYVALADTMYNKGGTVKKYLTNGKIDCDKVAHMRPINERYYSGVKNRSVINYKLCTGELQWKEVYKTPRNKDL